MIAAMHSSDCHLSIRTCGEKYWSKISQCPTTRAWMLRFRSHGDTDNNFVSHGVHDKFYRSKHMFQKNPTSVCHKTENVPQLCKNNWPDIPLGLFYGVAPWSNLSAVSFLPWHQIWLIEQLKSFRINQMQKTHKRMYEQPQKPHANYSLINGLT